MSSLFKMFLCLVLMASVPSSVFAVSDSDICSMFRATYKAEGWGTSNTEVTGCSVDDTWTISDRWKKAKIFAEITGGTQIGFITTPWKTTSTYCRTMEYRKDGSDSRNIEYCD